MSIKRYTRKAVMASLDDYCHFAKEHDFMEVTQWENGEGWDITIEAENHSRTFKLTDGEMRALIVLTNIAEVKDKEEKEPIDWDGN